MPSCLFPMNDKDSHDSLQGSPAVKWGRAQLVQSLASAGLPTDGLPGLWKKVAARATPMTEWNVGRVDMDEV